MAEWENIQFMTRDCNTCSFWKGRSSRKKGHRIPGGTGKCTSANGPDFCRPHTVRGNIGDTQKVHVQLVGGWPEQWWGRCFWLKRKYADPMIRRGWAMEWPPDQTHLGPDPETLQAFLKGAQE